MQVEAQRLPGASHCGIRIRALRKQRKLTQRDIAALTGFTAQQRIELECLKRYK